MEQNMSLRILLSQVGHLYIKRAMILKKKYGISGGGGGILFHLNETDGMSQKALADKMGVKPPSITVALRKLEGKNYITKKPDEKDQRITRIYITDSGREEAKKTKKVMLQVDEEIFANITHEEKMLLRRLLMQMKENLCEKEGMEEETGHFLGWKRN